MEFFRFIELCEIIFFLFFSYLVLCGFFSFVVDYIEQCIDFNELFVFYFSLIYFVKVMGDLMIEVGISDGDLLVVDSLWNVDYGDIVIVVIEGEFIVKWLQLCLIVQLIFMNGVY